MQRVPPEVEEAMVSAYLSGETLKAAAGRFGRSTTACVAALRRRGIPCRPARRHYALDEAYFDVIDTEARAYWLGFLAGDGCIGVRRSRPATVQLSLSERDEDHVRAFLAALGAGHPVRDEYTVLRGRTFRKRGVVIGSERLAAALGTHGVRPAKSHVVGPSPGVPEHLARHYWRGLMDADGSIVPHDARGYWTISLVGSEATCIGFLAFVQGNGITTRRRVLPHRSIFAVQFVGASLPRAVGALLYDGATVALERKRSSYERMRCMLG